MEEFKEFQGKDLDACIKEACSYFNTEREKLEVEIIQDAKSGIFGIVGARKAKIRARRLQLSENMLNFLDAPMHTAQTRDSDKNKASRNDRYESKKNAPPKAPKTDKQRTPAKAEVQGAKESRKSRSECYQHNPDNSGIVERTFIKASPFNEDQLLSLASATITKLLRPIADKDLELDTELGRGLVRVKVAWEGDAGLLIGREGQTLASLQYIASRILSHAVNSGVRVQLEIGDYKSRQDEKLKERAHALANKARQTGKSWSTPPLSSYHRRIVHMELQDEPDIMTRSAGEGMMKKVIITPKRTADLA